MAKAFIQESTLTDIADAIRGKLGVSTQYLPSEMADAIESIPSGGGGGAVEKKDVNFYDYDGTLLYSYTAAEALALDAKPDLPDHRDIGLLSDGWTCTLAEMQTFVTAYGKMDIGALYYPYDDAIHIICVAEGDRMTANVQINPSVANDAVVDWGDASEETWETTGRSAKTHTYAREGVYEIKIRATNAIDLGASFFSNRTITSPDGTKASVNWGKYVNYRRVVISKKVSALGNSCFNSCFSLQEIVIPSTVTSLGNSCFVSCYNLRSIILPKLSIGTFCFSNCNSLSSIVLSSTTTTLLGDNCFDKCYALQSVVIPSTVTSLGNNCFKDCNSLYSIVIPSTVTSIGSNCFSNCYMLYSIVIPSSVTTIGGSCFSNCNSIYVYRFKATTPPTVASNSLYVRNGLTIYVPTGKLSDYQTATNWSTWAAKMTEE